MRTREQIDPELHTLKSVIRGCTDGRERGELETARFNIFAAFQGRNPERARSWTTAMRAALLATEDIELRNMGLRALDTIVEALE